jgi:hypothetical protein
MDPLDECGEEKINFLHTPRLEPQTVQPAESRYTYYAIQALFALNINIKFQ